MSGVKQTSMDESHRPSRSSLTLRRRRRPKLAVMHNTAQRGSRAGRERAKSQRRKTITQKRRGALKTTRLHDPSAADHKTQSDVAQLTRERDEALERERATAEVLRVISSSPRELDPVFKTMMENATRLCEADSASLGLCEGADVRIVARYNASAALLEQTKREPLFRPGPTSGVGRSIRLKQVVQVPDIVNDQMYFDREPARVRLVEAGYRSQLSVPLEHNPIELNRNGRDSQRLADRRVLPD
jgi:hypothetical protein